MREPTPVLARDEPLQVALDLHGVLVTREPQALREASHVCVDDDPLRVAQLRGNDVRRLARHARKPE